MPTSNPRLADFTDHLTQNGIPISGVSNAGGTLPTGVTIQFLESATQEQMDFAENARLTFDWRQRVLFSRNQIVAGIASLTQPQQTILLRHLAAALIRMNKAEALDILTVAGIVLPVDQIDPNS